MHSFSRAVRICLLYSLSFVGISFGEEGKPDPRIIPDGWLLFVGKVPPGFVPVLGPLKSVNEIPPGKVRLNNRLGDPATASRVFDISESMATELGIELSNRSAVYYHENSATVIAIATEEEIAALESRIGGEFGHVMPHVRVTATLAELSVPLRRKIDGLSYTRLRSIAGDSWKELEHLQLSTTSGQRAVARSRSDSSNISKLESSQSDSPLLEDGMNGTALELEPVIGPGAQKIDLSFRWVRRAVEAPKSLDVISTLAIADGSTVLAAQWPLRQDSNTTRQLETTRTLVLVLSAEIVTEEGTLLRDVYRDQLRKIRERNKENSEGK